jgi:hypothetical protein
MLWLEKLNTGGYEIKPQRRRAHRGRTKGELLIRDAIGWDFQLDGRIVIRKAESLCELCVSAVNIRS